MDALSLEALMYDSSKCRQLSMDQKRELVYELSKWSEVAPEMLQAWSRQEILQVLCAELGKERKYTGLTKSKIIELLLKIVHDKKALELGTANVLETDKSEENGERTLKRQRKSDRPNCLLGTSDTCLESTIYCKNSACKAKLNSHDGFCKRCSCCICLQYDDNKDPSLWLICNSDPPFLGMACSMSCHLECALRHEKSGISKDRQGKGLDGSFRCVSCGKVNDLLGSWRKQLVVASDTRRVDILCYRLSLGQKMLDGTKIYQNLYEIVDGVVKKLEDDVGPLTGLPVKKARGIVNRLSSGPEIQRLCAFAIESLDLILSNRVSYTPEKLVKFEDLHASSVTVILDSDDSNLRNASSYTLWHRKVDDAEYPLEPTCRLFEPKIKFLISGLTPATHYFLKVVPLVTGRETGFCELLFQTRNSQDEVLNLNSTSSEVERSQSPATNCSSLSNPSSIEDETNNENRRDNYPQFCSNNDKTATTNLLHEETTEDVISFLDEGPMGNDEALNVRNKELPSGQMVEETRCCDNGSKTPRRTSLEYVPYVDSSETGLPITPSKMESMKDVNGRSNRTKINENGVEIVFKRSGEMGDEQNNGIGDKEFEYYVKVIRWLECEGHIDTAFRQKFLTWYSMRATSREVRVVKVFIDTFIEDPSSLAGQLADIFSEVASNKRCAAVPPGFCMKLWH
ncbi:VIN3-like protein 2 isoform X1 [Primulina tabacum]|uniref:VIN3-like protein 2 isoform X1 n=2 Tax=Primulina tabacum TaxID=48773 RepID=UPI003F595BBA